MIHGIGNDIIEIDRIASVITRYGVRFLDRVFTAAEQEYCLQHTHSEARFAGRFAAKEAVAKALGTGLSQGLHWLDIEVLPNDLGQPQVFLSATATERFSNPQLMVAISHSKHHATGVALWQERPHDKNTNN